MALQIPTIDLDSGWQHPDVVKSIKSACENWGFFQIMGHQIDPVLRRELFQVTRQFFQLSATQKQLLCRTGTNFWGFYDHELTKNQRDQKEIFDIDANLTTHASGTTDMPVPWPEQISQFKPLMTHWMTCCETLSQQLLSSICLALEQSPDSLSPEFGKQHSSFLRLNYYPLSPQPTTSERGPLGINRHSDAGALTVLAQDDVPALQVRKGRTWHTVMPLANAFIINVGDMMQVWSNDRFVAAEHRVLSSSDRVRYSAPYFYNPSYQAIVKPLTGSNEGPVFRPVPWGEFRQGRASGDYADQGEEIQIARYRIQDS
ncbi:MAG: hypothetical protein JKY98_09660 [Gammaproteobacteria bacterium]|nr:hypothetical protein [Gammaproteobacteria bacterium]